MMTVKKRMERSLFSGETCEFGALMFGRRLLSFLFVALLLGGLSPLTSAAGSIGVNFNSDVVAAVDPVNGTAGAVAQSNWNNTQSLSGSIASGSVIDSSGATVGGMSVTWSGDDAWSVGGADATGEGDDTALMHGGIEEQHATYGTGAGTEITLTGIPYTRYNLYVYVNGWSAGRTGEAQLEVGGNVVSGSQRQFLVMGAEFIDGTHTHSESTGTADVGTYVLWENLTAANLTAQVRKINNNIMITGLQIVEVAVPDISEQNIGINFNSATATAVDPVTGTAGAVPQANWNNVSNKTGSVAGSVLEDSGATLEGMSISWSGNAAWSVGGAIATGEGDDTALMHGGVEVQDLAYGANNEITLTGIPYVEYDIYVYVNGWNANRTGEAQIEVGGSVVSGSQRQFKGMGTDFIDGTHTHSESTGSSDIGTYVLWEDLTAADTVVQLRNLVGGTQPIVVGLQVVKTPPAGTLVSIR